MNGFDRDKKFVSPIQERKTKETYTLPLLSEIPLLGKLFERETENTSKAELVIMLTPEVMVGQKIDDRYLADTRNLRKLGIKP